MGKVVPFPLGNLNMNEDEANYSDGQLTEFKNLIINSAGNITTRPGTSSIDFNFEVEGEIPVKLFYWKGINKNVIITDYGNVYMFEDVGENSYSLTKLFSIKDFYGNKVSNIGKTRFNESVITNVSLDSLVFVPTLNIMVSGILFEITNYDNSGNISSVTHENHILRSSYAVDSENNITQISEPVDIGIAGKDASGAVIANTAGKVSFMEYSSRDNLIYYSIGEKLLSYDGGTSINLVYSFTNPITSMAINIQFGFVFVGTYGAIYYKNSDNNGEITKITTTDLSGNVISMGWCKDSKETVFTTDGSKTIKIVSGFPTSTFEGEVYDVIGYKFFSPLVSAKLITNNGANFLYAIDDKYNIIRISGSGKKYIASLYKRRPYDYIRGISAPEHMFCLNENKLLVVSGEKESSCEYKTYIVKIEQEWFINKKFGSDSTFSCDFAFVDSDTIIYALAGNSKIYFYKYNLSTNEYVEIHSLDFSKRTILMQAYGGVAYGICYDGDTLGNIDYNGIFFSIDKNGSYNPINTNIRIENSTNDFSYIEILEKSGTPYLYFYRYFTDPENFYLSKIKLSDGTVTNIHDFSSSIVLCAGETDRYIYIASVGDDKTVYKLDIETENIQQYYKHSNNIVDINYSREDSKLYIADFSYKLYTYDGTFPYLVFTAKDAVTAPVNVSDYNLIGGGDEAEMLYNYDKRYETYDFFENDIMPGLIYTKGIREATQIILRRKFKKNEYDGNVYFLSFGQWASGFAVMPYIAFHYLNSEKISKDTGFVTDIKNFKYQVANGAVGIPSIAKLFYNEEPKAKIFYTSSNIFGYNFRSSDFSSEPYQTNYTNLGKLSYGTSKIIDSYISNFGSLNNSEKYFSYNYKSSVGKTAKLVIIFVTNESILRESYDVPDGANIIWSMAKVESDNNKIMIVTNKNNLYYFDKVSKTFTLVYALSTGISVVWDIVAKSIDLVFLRYNTPYTPDIVGIYKLYINKKYYAEFEVPLGSISIPDTEAPYKFICAPDDPNAYWHDIFVNLNSGRLIKLKIFTSGNDKPTLHSYKIYDDFFANGVSGTFHCYLIDKDEKKIYFGNTGGQIVSTKHGPIIEQGFFGSYYAGKYEIALTVYSKINGNKIQSLFKDSNNSLIACTDTGMFLALEGDTTFNKLNIEQDFSEKEYYKNVINISESSYANSEGKVKNHLIFLEGSKDSSTIYIVEPNEGKYILPLENLEPTNIEILETYNHKIEPNNMDEIEAPFLIINFGGKLFYYKYQHGAGMLKYFYDINTRTYREKKIPAIGSIAYINNCLVFSQANSDYFFWSFVNEILHFDESNNYASADQSPSNIIKMKNNWSSLFICSNEDIEVWTFVPSSNTSLLFQRKGVIKQGIISKEAVEVFENTILFLANDRNFYITEDTNIQKIYSPYIKKYFSYDNIDVSVIGYMNTENKRFVFINISGENYTGVFDIDERIFSNFSSVIKSALNNKITGNDFIISENKIKRISRDYNKDDLNSIPIEIKTGFITYNTYNYKKSLNLCFSIIKEVDDTTPLVVQYRDKKDDVFSGEKNVPLNSKGEFTVWLRRLGKFRKRQYKITYSGTNSITFRSISEEIEELKV